MSCADKTFSPARVLGSLRLAPDCVSRRYFLLTTPVSFLHATCAAHSESVLRAAWATTRRCREAHADQVLSDCTAIPFAPAGFLLAVSVDGLAARRLRPSVAPYAFLPLCFPD